MYYRSDSHPSHLNGLFLTKYIWESIHLHFFSCRKLLEKTSVGKELLSGGEVEPPGTQSCAWVSQVNADIIHEDSAGLHFLSSFLIILKHAIISLRGDKFSPKLYIFLPVHTWIFFLLVWNTVLHRKFSTIFCTHLWQQDHWILFSHQKKKTLANPLSDFPVMNSFVYLKMSCSFWVRLLLSYTGPLGLEFSGRIAAKRHLQNSLQLHSRARRECLTLSGVCCSRPLLSLGAADGRWFSL